MVVLRQRQFSKEKLKPIFALHMNTLLVKPSRQHALPRRQNICCFRGCYRSTKFDSRAEKVEEVSDTPKIAVTDSTSWYLMDQTDTVLMSCKADSKEQLHWELSRALTRPELSRCKDNW